jgi:methylthioribose-1-phosphate isomerase
VLARDHDVPFYVAAPVATIDFATETGAGIPIEERGRAEIAQLGGRKILPDGVGVRHPAFDVTPARLVSAIITERGIARAEYGESLGLFRR